MAFLLLSASIGTSLAFASSSEDDDDDDDNFQEDDRTQNEQQTQQPPQNTQQSQSQITWKNFKDRNNLFTVQYPSNWTPGAPATQEVRGPINTIFFAPVRTDKLAQIQFIQYAQPSVFATPQEALKSEINTSQNDPTTTKFEIESPIECSKYTLNGLPACSYIYETQSTPESGYPNQAILAVDAQLMMAPNMKRITMQVYDLFERFLPVAESMIKTFQTTGSNTSTSDFSLSGGSNTAGLQMYEFIKRR